MIGKLGKRKKEIKIVKETDVNYTFINTASYSVADELESNIQTKTISNSEKELIKMRSMDSKKSKARHKSRVVGGHNRQSHSSVYE